MDDYDVTENQQEATEAKAAPKRRSRRATRPAGTPERPTLDVRAALGLPPLDGAAPEETEAPDGVVSVEPEAAPSELDESAVADSEVDETVVDETEADVAQSQQPDDAASVEDAPVEDDAPEAETPEPEDSLRLPATALLFQAPDLTPRRRRRASAPAGSPEAAETETVEPDTLDGLAEAPAQPRKKSNRRSKKKAEEAVAEPQDEPGQAESGQDESAEDETSNEASTDEGEESSAPKRRRRRGGRGRRKGKSGDNDSDSGEQEADESGGDSANSDSDTDSDQASDGSAEGDAKDKPEAAPKRGRRRGKKAASAEAAEPAADAGESDEAESAESSESSEDDDSSSEGSSSRRRRRRRSRSTRDEGARARDEVTALKGSTRLEAKRQRRRDGRDANRRRSIITEAEFLARRESVNRDMVVRERGGRTQIAVLEDDVLVEHFVARKTQTSMVGNVYLGRVQNVLPSMEAAFVDLGRGRNAVLYAGEVNWDAAGLEGQPRRIEQALTSGDSVLVQVTKDPIGHKGARLTSQITLAGRYLVLVPSGTMTGISRKLPDIERNRLKKLLKEIVPEGQGVIVRTAAEGASEDELRRDVERLTQNWADIEKKVAKTSTTAPVLLKGEPELSTRVVRDVFNEDFRSLTVQGDEAWKTISEYVSSVAPDLADRLHQWTDAKDVFASHRIDEQLTKGMDRKVYLPSGGSLVIDRTEAMTVVDVNTGKFTGTGGTLEETVTRNNLEAAEEIVRQLRLRDIGGIIVVDFIDMVLESNRDLVLRRLVECLGRDRTRHQVAEVTSLGLVQMTRKRVGQGLVEAFSSTCEHCHGRGYMLHDEPVESGAAAAEEVEETPRSGRGGRTRGRRSNSQQQAPAEPAPEDTEQRAQVRATLAAIAAAAAHAHEEHAPDGATNLPPSSEELLETVLEIESIPDGPVQLDVFVQDEQDEPEATEPDVVESDVAESDVVEPEVSEPEVSEPEPIEAEASDSGETDAVESVDSESAELESAESQSSDEEKQD